MKHWFQITKKTLYTPKLSCGKLILLTLDGQKLERLPLLIRPVSKNSQQADIVTRVTEHCSLSPVVL